MAEPPPPLGRPSVESPGIFAAYLLLAALATYPLLFHLTDHAVGTSNPPGEATPPLNIWAMAVVLHQLPHPRELFEGNAFHPHAHSLAFSEHLFVPALLGAPVALLTGNRVLAYNVVTFLTLAGAGFGMFLLAREITGDRIAAFAAGCLYAFHTWNVNELVRLQILSNQWFPFLVLCLLRFFARPGWKRAALVGLFFALQGLSCMYWGLYLPFFVAGVGLFLQWRHRLAWRALVPLAAALAVSAALLGVFAIPYARTARDMGFQRPAPPSVPVQRYLEVLPANVMYKDVLGKARPTQNAAHFLGFTALALGGLGLRKREAAAGALRPLFLGLIGVGFLLSLGPELILGDRVIGPGPYTLLRGFVPGFRNVRYPERLSLFVVLGLAPLVAVGLSSLRSRLRPVGMLLVTGLLFAEHLSIPSSLSYIPAGASVHSVYPSLRERKDVNVVANVPSSFYLMERADALPMYLSTFYWKPTVLGFTSYFPPSYPYLKWRLFHFPESESVRFLERFGVDTLIVTPGAEGLPQWARPDPRWSTLGPFPEGELLLRLKGAGRMAFEPPSDDVGGLHEANRRGWAVEAAVGEPRLGIDGDPATAWGTERNQEEGDYYRVRFPRPLNVARVSLLVRTPHQESAEFPLHVRLLGKSETGPWVELPFDQARSYDRLFQNLLFRPREATMDIDIAPQVLRGITLQIDQTDPYWMPWTLPELRVYEPG